VYSDLVVGFNDSPAARDALVFARRLALATGARPMVLYVRPSTALSAEVTADSDDLSWEAGVEAKLGAARELLAGVPGVTFEGVADVPPPGRSTVPRARPTRPSSCSARPIGRERVASSPGPRPTP
jgi:hypothetical protein